MSVRSFARDKSATSAIEFALVVPFLLTLLLAVVELQRYMRLERRLTVGAHAVAQIVADRRSENQSRLNVDIDVLSQILADYRAEYSGKLWENLAHQITGVVFRPTVDGCTTQCTYNAYVDQVRPTNGTEASIPALDLKRVCGQLKQVAAGDPASKDSISAPFGPGSLIVVDLRALFTPIMGAQWLPATYITRQGYATPRHSLAPIRFPQASPDSLTLRCSIP